MPGLFGGLPPLRDTAAWRRALTTPEAPPLVQFIKYAMAGALAMAANLLFFWFADRFWFPIGGGGEGVALPSAFSEIPAWLGRMGNDERVLNYARCNAVAFVFANTVAYLLNFKWVFRAGRHSRALEIALFFGVSLVSFGLGTGLAGMLVGGYGVHEYAAKGADVVSAVLVNYVCRKFLIFHG